jgi:rubrerythrin
MMDSNEMVQLYAYLMDEVEGFKDYSAMSYKYKLSNNSSLASTFQQMAQAEKGHAEALLKMINEHLSKSENSELKMFIKEINSYVLKDIQ